MDVYVTRDSYTIIVQVWPATVGIRKFHGCVEYGAAWNKSFSTSRLSPVERRSAECHIVSDSSETMSFDFFAHYILLLIK